MRDLRTNEQIEGCGSDDGYVDGIHLLESCPLSVKLLWPVPWDGSWQARAEGAFDTICCAIDWLMVAGALPSTLGWPKRVSSI
jgi:hypothetical protein